MKFSIFKSVRDQRGQECTYERFIEACHSERVLELCNKIAAEEDKDKRGELKKQLPVITWQAYFPQRRLNKEAIPSGLFMLDIDHVEDPFKLFSEKVIARIAQLGIVFVGMTASRHGLRIVAKCRKECNSLAECQEWLAKSLDVEFDDVCKDYARCSFLVHETYTYYMNAGAIWEPDNEAVVYKNEENDGQPAPEPQPPTEPQPAEINDEFEQALKEAAQYTQQTEPDKKIEKAKEVDQREGLFGGDYKYKGLDLESIAKEWLEQTGGIEVGVRNIRLYKLALRMRYICDFNEAVMLKVMPRHGLPESEMRELIQSALKKQRASDLPIDLQMVIKNMQKRGALVDEDTPLPDVITDTSKLPPLPPVIKQFVENAPDDFKQAVLMCQLPILGALGSRLRAKYIDGQPHSPSFLVSLEAPQASGKSFMRKLANYELASMIEHDNEQRQKEQDYEKKIREMKLLNIKVTKENKDDVIGSRPETLIRFVPATMSITKLLMRMNAAKGLHLFSMAEEIDTVTKAFKRGFSSFSDLLRVGFDNGQYGQDYASENSFSGIIPIYYNMLTSGTPKAMRRFYPDVEDGLVSRVAFVTLPDQFGKRMPQWKELTAEQKKIVDRGLISLNEISIVGDEVQDEHLMKMNWLNLELEKWVLAQQAEAIKEDDRTRDIFCRRSAVIGFRAGMLAFFLYDEKTTPPVMRNVKKFAIYVANSVLNQHLLRFKIDESGSNTNQWERAYKQLPDKFNRLELEKVLRDNDYNTETKTVLYRWKLSNLIETEKEGVNERGQKMGVVYKKVK